MAFDEILEWSGKQAEWTQDALRRLVRRSGRPLSEADYNEILTRVKHVSGIDKGEIVDCVPLSTDDLPKNVEAIERTLLCSIGTVKHVDRLAEDQTIPFALDGITLIYGDNGSGKSGYTRITKNLCRSLTPAPLRSNVFEEETAGPAETVVRYKTDDQEEPTEETWIGGSQPPAAIADISVFDAKNARLYVDQENKIQYLPPEIELMENYSNLLQAMSGNVSNETGEIEKRIKIPLPTGFTEGSSVSALIAPLVQASIQQKKSDNDNPSLPSLENLTAAAEWNEELDKELTGLEEVLRSNPAVQATACKRAAAALTNIVDTIKTVDAALSDEKSKELETKVNKAKTTKAAADTAASDAFKDEPLPHTGSDKWQLMYRYAKEFAQLVGGKEIQSISADDICVACQQKLSPEAKERLKRFEDFISNRANSEAEKATAELTAAKEALQNLKILTKVEAEQKLAEFSDMSEEAAALALKAVEYMEAASQRRNSLLSAAVVDDFSKIEPVPESCAQLVEGEATALSEQEKKLAAKAAEDKGQDKETKRLADLRDQKKLSENIETFKARLSDLEAFRKLKTCEKSLSTGDVSRFISKLRKDLITDDLQNRIQGEIGNFELSHIPFIVKDRSAGGKSYVGVKLKAASEVDNEEILSEGEQRALALACFLGEICGDPVKHGIIIDDPVSSLDHIRIRRVAERLVREASEGRQAVIFTHNLVFYNEVINAAAKAQTPVLPHCIRKDENAGFGIVHAEDAPWLAKKVNDRIKVLKEERLPAFKDRTDIDTDEYRREAKDFYTDLRETWERFVEEVLLGGVISRFNADVKTQSLKQVVVTDDDYKTIFHAMKKVSERSGHDMSDARNIPVPSYDDMKIDLEELDKFRDEVKKRSKKTGEDREKLEKPPLASVA